MTEKKKKHMVSAILNVPPPHSHRYAAVEREGEVVSVYVDGVVAIVESDADGILSTRLQGVKLDETGQGTPILDPICFGPAPGSACNAAHMLLGERSRA